MLDRRSLLSAAGGMLAFPAQAYAPGRIINAMMTDEPATLCYPLFNTRLTQEICGNINESLLLFDWQFRPHPNLARAFEMASDGLTYTFHLRSDVQWHDGAKFTARDVVFSCGTMLPQLNPRSRNAFSHVESVTAKDAYTVVFRLKEPFNAFLLSLMASSAPMMPAHIYEGSDFRTNPFNVKPIGTGPFRFAQWKRGQFIHLARNDHYWRPGQPGMDGIYYRVCPTPEQRMVAMETGAVDLALADDIDTVVNSRLVANPSLVARTDAYNGTGEITVMELNMRRWPFSDRRFRAAFMYAIDREFLVKGINFGLGKVAHSPIPSTAPYHDDKVLTKYPHDPAKARALLDEMGLRPKLGGVRHRFGIMLTPDGGGAWTRGAQYVKQALAEVGAGGGAGSYRLAHPEPAQRQLGVRLRLQQLWRIWRSRHRHLALLSHLEHPQGCAADQPAGLLQFGDRPAVPAGGGGHRSRRGAALLQPHPADPHPRRRHAVAV